MIAKSRGGKALPLWDNAPMSRITRILPVVLLAAGAAAAGAWFAARHGENQPPAHARVLDTPRPVPAVPMTAPDGRPLEPSLFRGRWTLVFFGFTNCPDVCPTTLQVLAGASRRLDDLPTEQRPQVAMVSVDPGRDTPEPLGRYVAFFDPAFKGISVAGEHLP